LQAAPLKEASSWIEEYRQHWEQRLDRLDAYLQELQAQERQARQAKTVSMSNEKKTSVRRKK
jgi:hypothetical protein